MRIFVSQAARYEPQLAIHSSKPAHAGLFAIKGGEVAPYHAVDPGLIAYENFSLLPSSDWPEAAVNFPTTSRCSIIADNDITLGHVAVHESNSDGIMTRLINRVRRTFTATIWDHEFRAQITIRRPFYLLYSDIFFSTTEGGRLGSMHRRFNLFAVLYDIKDSKGRLIASMTRSFLGRGLTIHDVRGSVIGEVHFPALVDAKGSTKSEAPTRVATSGCKLNDVQKATLITAIFSVDLMRRFNQVSHKPSTSESMR